MSRHDWKVLAAIGISGLTGMMMSTAFRWIDRPEDLSPTAFEEALESDGSWNPKVYLDAGGIPHSRRERTRTRVNRELRFRFVPRGEAALRTHKIRLGVDRPLEFHRPANYSLADFTFFGSGRLEKPKYMFLPSH